jgi:hypothetical protein
MTGSPGYLAQAAPDFTMAALLPLRIVDCGRQNNQQRAQLPRRDRLRVWICISCPGRSSTVTLCDLLEARTQQAGDLSQPIVFGLQLQGSGKPRDDGKALWRAGGATRRVENARTTWPARVSLSLRNSSRSPRHWLTGP